MAGAKLLHPYAPAQSLEMVRQQLLLLDHPRRAARPWADRTNLLEILVCCCAVEGNVLQSSFGEVTCSVSAVSPRTSNQPPTSAAAPTTAHKNSVWPDSHRMIIPRNRLKVFMPKFYFKRRINRRRACSRRVVQRRLSEFDDRLVQAANSYHLDRLSRALTAATCDSSRPIGH